MWKSYNIQAGQIITDISLSQQNTADKREEEKDDDEEEEEEEEEEAREENNTGEATAGNTPGEGALVGTESIVASSGDTYLAQFLRTPTKTTCRRCFLLRRARLKRLKARFKLQWRSLKRLKARLRLFNIQLPTSGRMTSSSTPSPTLSRIEPTQSVGLEIQQDETSNFSNLELKK